MEMRIILALAAKEAKRSTNSTKLSTSKIVERYAANQQDVSIEAERKVVPLLARVHE